MANVEPLLALAFEVKILFVRNKQKDCSGKRGSGEVNAVSFYRADKRPKQNTPTKSRIRSS